MSRSVRLLPLLLLAWSALAWPNGGPADWDAPAAAGEGAPTAPADIRLLSEDLRLTLGEDPNVYEVEARYVLANPGPPRELGYEVPVIWGASDVGEPSDEDVQAASKGITIELDGQKTGCVAARADGEPERIAIPGQEQEEARVGAWCRTKLRIPTGEKISLTLRYRASMVYMDWETSKSALPSFAPRNLVYPLFPAGRWAGKPRVDLSLDLGPWAADTTVRGPAGSRREGNVVHWSWPAADLGKLRAVVATVDAHAELMHRHLVGINAGDSGVELTLQATASSTLTGGSYAADRLLDGRGDTAWCEGVDGPGLGEWVELSVAKLPSMPMKYCELQGLVIVPGYAKSQAVWEANDRVTSVTLGPCGGTATTVPVKAAPRHDASATVIPLAWSEDPVLAAIAERAKEDPQHLCLRLGLAGAEKGAKYADTCISELAALVNCG